MLHVIVVGCYAQDGWMDALRFYVLYNCITVISGDNGRLCAMEVLHTAFYYHPPSSYAQNVLQAARRLQQRQKFSCVSIVHELYKRAPARRKKFTFQV